MKKLYMLLAICLISSLLLFGCVPSPDGEGGGYITEDGNVVDGPSDDGYITEDGNVVGDEGNGENTGDNNTEDENSDGVDDPDGNNPVEPEQPKYGTGVGDRFIGVTLETLSGGSVNTKEFSDKIIILNIWATWCPPCKQELPDFNTIASEYKDDVVIIAAHTPNGNEAAKSYVETNFPETDIIFAYDTPSSMAYIVAGGDGYVPYTAIIDQNGVIVYSASGILSHSQLASILEGLLEK